MTAPINPLPGRCVGCGSDVWWRSKAWRSRADGKGKRHVCPEDRALCGAFMPYARERCARRPGHLGHHSTRWAMDNALQAYNGRRLVA